MNEQLYLYEIWSRDDKECLAEIWVSEDAIAQKIATALNGEAFFQAVGVIHPE